MTADHPTIDHALAQIRAGLREADAALDAIGDVAEAFTRATAFAKTAQKEVRVSTTRSRGRQVKRAWDEQALALAALAERVTEAGGEEISPQRLGQLATRAEEEPCST